MDKPQFLGKQKPHCTRRTFCMSMHRDCVRANILALSFICLVLPTLSDPAYPLPPSLSLSVDTSCSHRSAHFALQRHQNHSREIQLNQANYIKSNHRMHNTSCALVIRPNCQPVSPPANNNIKTKLNKMKLKLFFGSRWPHQRKESHTRHVARCFSVS